MILQQHAASSWTAAPENAKDNMEDFALCSVLSEQKHKNTF